MKKYLQTISLLLLFFNATGLYALDELQDIPLKTKIYTATEADNSFAFKSNVLEVVKNGENTFFTKDVDAGLVFGSFSTNGSTNGLTIDRDGIFMESDTKSNPYNLTFYLIDKIHYGTVEIHDGTTNDYTSILYFPINETGTLTTKEYVDVHKWDYHTQITNKPDNLITGTFWNDDNTWFLGNESDENSIDYNLRIGGSGETNVFLSPGSVSIMTDSNQVEIAGTKIVHEGNVYQYPTNSGTIALAEEHLKLTGGTMLGKILTNTEYTNFYYGIKLQTGAEIKSICTHKSLVESYSEDIINASIGNADFVFKYVKDTTMTGAVSRVYRLSNAQSELYLNPYGNGHLIVETGEDAFDTIPFTFIDSEVKQYEYLDESELVTKAWVNNPTNAINFYVGNLLKQLYIGVAEPIDNATTFLKIGTRNVGHYPENVETNDYRRGYLELFGILKDNNKHIRLTVNGIDVSKNYPTNKNMSSNRIHWNWPKYAGGTIALTSDIKTNISDLAGVDNYAKKTDIESLEHDPNFNTWISANGFSGFTTEISEDQQYRTIKFSHNPGSTQEDYPLVFSLNTNDTEVAYTFSTGNYSTEIYKCSSVDKLLSYKLDKSEITNLVHEIIVNAINAGFDFEGTHYKLISE